MKTGALRANLLPVTGLVVGPVLWAVMMQIGQIIPAFDCRTGLHMGAGAPLAGAALALWTAHVSWRARDTGRSAAMAYPVSRPFVAGLGALCGLVFAYAMLLQAGAGLVLTGCER